MINRRPRIPIEVSHRAETPTKDRHGNPVYAYSGWETRRVYVIAPAARDEPSEQEGRPNAVLTGWNIYGPPTTSIGPYDRVRLPDGTVTEVVGEPGVWANNPHSPTGRHEGVQVRVERSKG